MSLQHRSAAVLLPAGSSNAARAPRSHLEAEGGVAGADTLSKVAG